MSGPDPSVIGERLAALRDRIRAAGGEPDGVTVVAVTKAHPPEVIGAAVRAGLADLGENYAQELTAKAAVAPAAVRWHFIGRLQRNKVRQLAPVVSLWQSVDRAALLDEIARRAPGAAVLLQVNATGEEGKGGCPPGDVEELLERATAAGLRVTGLMTVGPTDPITDPVPAFRLVRGLVDRFGLVTCSMGMTGDLEAAVAEGSTMVRVGTALFGPRLPERRVGN